MSTMIGILAVIGGITMVAAIGVELWLVWVTGEIVRSLDDDIPW